MIEIGLEPRRLNIAKWLEKNKGGKCRFDGRNTWRCDDGKRYVAMVSGDFYSEDALGCYYLYGDGVPRMISFS